MGRRLDLHNVLIGVLGSNSVYFQPPETTQMVYPCIVYELANIATTFADDAPYSMTRKYMVTVIDRNPDSEIPTKLARLKLSSMDRHYVSNKLHHYVFTIYY